MNCYKEIRISLYVVAAIMTVSIFFYFVATMVTSMGYDKMRNDDIPVIENNDCDDKTIIIIDPGHGGEDTGASCDVYIEKTLNLDISFVLKEYFDSLGYYTAITRTDDRMLYGVGEENRKKYYDLRNRVLFAENYSDGLFISMHMNKFPASYCNGLQVFYSENNKCSLQIADSIQRSVRLLQAENNRKIKSGQDTIYILNKLEMPAVLIECGFISNPTEAELLLNKDYQKALAFSIFCGVAECLEGK